MKIKFLGAAQEVTGSKHLIITDEGKKILLDCGMYQGKGDETDAHNRNLGFIPQEIDYIILTHAHIDHSGLIPYVYKQPDFKASIYCTSATRNLCSIMLPDSGYIQENDIHWYNKKLARQGKQIVEPIYDHKIATESLKNFVSVSYNREIMLEPGIFLKFTNTGHMLGSAVANLTIYQNGKAVKIAYTGDIGRKNPRILLPPSPFPQCDYLIMESTYGDRVHPNLEDSEGELLRIINHTCVKKRGKLIIPSFSVGRTQEIVYSLNNFFNENKLPNTNIYIDSPLSVKATDIFRVNRDCFNEEVLDVLDRDIDIFGFDKLRYIKDINESKRLNRIKDPCVIISASGMAEAGRVKHHIANSIDNHKNTILIVGYCTPISLGARLQEEGLKEISIFGETHHVNAEIKKIETFSGHADYTEMIDFIGCQDKTQIKQLFLVHGEEKSQQFFKKKLKNAGFQNVTNPQKGSEVEIK